MFASTASSTCSSSPASMMAWYSCLQRVGDGVHVLALAGVVLVARSYAVLAGATAVKNASVPAGSAALNCRGRAGSPPGPWYVIGPTHTSVGAPVSARGISWAKNSGNRSRSRPSQLSGISSSRRISKPLMRSSDVRRPARLAEFAVVDDVEADGQLLADDLGHRVEQQRVVRRRRRSASSSAAGRGKLPVCVVRMRSVLRLITPLLPRPNVRPTAQSGYTDQRVGATRVTGEHMRHTGSSAVPSTRGRGPGYGRRGPAGGVRTPARRRAPAHGGRRQANACPRAPTHGPAAAAPTTASRRGTDSRAVEAAASAPSVAKRGGTLPTRIPLAGHQARPARLRRRPDRRGLRQLSGQLRPRPSRTRPAAAARSTSRPGPPAPRRRRWTRTRCGRRSTRSSASTSRSTSSRRRTTPLSSCRRSSPATSCPTSCTSPPTRSSRSCRRSSSPRWPT